MDVKVRVIIIESERGWGQRIDDVKTFDTEEEADKFIKKFNSGNNKAEVPDWYMYARRAGYIKDGGEVISMHGG